MVSVTVFLATRLALICEQRRCIDATYYSQQCYESHARRFAWSGRWWWCECKIRSPLYFRVFSLGLGETQTPTAASLAGHTTCTRVDLRFLTGTCRANHRLPIFVKFEPRHPDARLIGRRVRITCMQFPVPTLRHCPVFCSSLAMLCSGLSHLSHLVCILNGSILSILCCDSPTKKASILSCCSRLRR